MKEYIQESKCLASLAVFRELYNSQKDVYDIISEFLTEVIVSNGKHQFGVIEITDLLNTSYYFDIPYPVVNTSLNRLDFLEKSQGQYLVNNLHNIKSKNLNTKQDEIQRNNDSLIEELFSYIELQKEILLSDDEKEKVVHSFCLFLLEDSTTQEYIEYISAFIVLKKQDSNFRSQLNTIKEGIVLYSGIKYNSNLNDIGSWRNELTIYIETEILFHFAGYNGEIQRTYFDDFFKFVKEINQKSPKPLIKLKYFREVKEEIERFFKKAEYIVSGNEKANPKVTAMSSILDGCTTPSDVLGKKSDFFSLLKTNGIQKDEYSKYYDESNFKFNILDQNVIEKVSQALGVDDISDYLKFLNFINIHRKGSDNGYFESIGCILLTGNSTTLKVAWNELVKKDKNVPLATTLSFLINKFWFKLNKGFGNNSYPKTFDVITKAQILLSKQLNESIGEKFESLQNDLKNGNLTEVQAIARIVDLRKQVRKPEEIEQDNVAAILDSISEDSIERFIQEQEHFKNKANLQAEENIKLKQNLGLIEQELKAKEIENKTKEAENQKASIDLVTKTLELKENILTEKRNSKHNLETIKVPLDEQINTKYNTFRGITAFLFVAFYCLEYYFIYKYGWDAMEKWTYIVGGIPVALSFLYLIVIENTFNPLSFFTKKKKDIQNSVYKKFNFQHQRLMELNVEEEKLINEIALLKSQLSTALQTVAPEKVI